MPNGFYGTQENWERIESPLRQLDNVLNKFANNHQLILIKNDHNWPSRSFRWGNKPEVLIQVFLESEKELTYTMWISASDERSRSEYWKHETLIKAVSIDILEKQLPALLNSAYATANEWMKTYNAAG